MENVLAIVWSILLTLGIMSIGGDAGTSSVSGSFFEVADVVFDLDQLPSDYKEVASIIHCACLTHFADATAEGFVYFTDDQKCWTSIQQSTNPGVGVTLQVGKRKVTSIPMVEEPQGIQSLPIPMTEEPSPNLNLNVDS